MKNYRFALLVLGVLFNVLVLSMVPRNTNAQVNPKPMSAQGSDSLPEACKAATLTQSADTIVFNNTVYFCTAKNTWSALGPLTAVANILSGSPRSCGPSPFTDITCFGARPTAARVTKAVNCNGTASVTSMSDWSGFVVGDGITIPRCGSTFRLATPSAPTVVPSVLSGPPETEQAVTSSAGGSTYSYSVVAIDQFGGYSAVSPTTTIKNGQALLGMRTLAVSGESLSNDTLTIKTSESNTLEVGAMFHVYGSTSASLSGWYRVAVVKSSTEFTASDVPRDSRAMGWYYPDAIASTGGKVDFFLSNHITIPKVAGAWAYCVYGRRPSDKSEHLIGITKPSGDSSGYLDLMFDDLGSPMMENQSIPQCPAMPPAAAQNDSLTTTITAIDGATATVAVATSHAETNQIAVLDAGPALLAAAKTVSLGMGQGYVYIPPTTVSEGLTFYVNSFVSLPAATHVLQGGPIVLSGSGTLELKSFSEWDGEAAAAGSVSFAISSGGASVSGPSGPVIYISHANNVKVENLIVSLSASNGGVAILCDSSYGVQFTNVQASAGPNDYIGLAFEARDVSGTEDNILFDTFSMNAGDGAVEAKGVTPGLWFAPGQDGSGKPQQSQFLISMHNIFLGHRGIVGTNPAGQTLTKLECDFCGRQGGNSPFILDDSAGGGWIDLNQLNLDTETQPVFVSLLSPLDFISIRNYSGGSIEGSGGVPPLVTGRRPYLGIHAENAMASVPPPNRDYSGCNSPGAGGLYAPPYFVNDIGTGPGNTPQAYCVFDTPVLFGSNTSLFWPGGLATSIAAKLALGGDLAVGVNYRYAIGTIGVDGGMSILSAPSSSCAPTVGKQTCIVTWANPNWAVSSDIFRCQALCLTPAGNPDIGRGNWRVISVGTTGNSLVDSGLAAGFQAPPISASGSTVINGNVVSGPQGIFQALQSSGAPAKLSGTGACSTITAQTGGAWSGSFRCTGTEGASTVTIRPGTTAHGWNCPASDETAGVAMPQSAHNTSTCTIRGTVTKGDVITFTAVAF